MQSFKSFHAISNNLTSSSYHGNRHQDLLVTSSTSRHTGVKEVGTVVEAVFPAAAAIATTRVATVKGHVAALLPTGCARAVVGGTVPSHAVRLLEAISAHQPGLENGSGGQHQHLAHLGHDHPVHLQELNNSRRNDGDGDDDSSHSLGQSTGQAIDADTGEPVVKKRRTKANGPPVRPQCVECGKDFSNQSALSKHKLTHSDERRFSCNLCGKAFKRQDHLNGHMLTHRDKKPYECDVEGCEKTYCDARSLRRHKENHHSALAMVVVNNGHGHHQPLNAHISTASNLTQPQHVNFTLIPSHPSPGSAIINRIQYAPPQATSTSPPPMTSTSPDGQSVTLTRMPKVHIQPTSALSQHVAGLTSGQSDVPNSTQLVNDHVRHVNGHNLAAPSAATQLQILARSSKQHQPTVVCQSNDGHGSHLVSRIGNFKTESNRFERSPPDVSLHGGGGEDINASNSRSRSPATDKLLHQLLTQSTIQREPSPCSNMNVMYDLPHKSHAMPELEKWQPTNCGLCSKTFKNQAALHGHMRFHVAKNPTHVMPQVSCGGRVENYQLDGGKKKEDLDLKMVLEKIKVITEKNLQEKDALRHSLPQLTAGTPITETTRQTSISNNSGHPVQMSSADVTAADHQRRQQQMSHQEAHAHGRYNDGVNSSNNFVPQVNGSSQSRHRSSLATNSYVDSGNSDDQQVMQSSQTARHSITSDNELKKNARLFYSLKESSNTNTNNNHEEEEEVSSWNIENDRCGGFRQQLEQQFRVPSQPQRGNLVQHQVQDHHNSATSTNELLTKFDQVQQIKYNLQSGEKLRRHSDSAADMYASTNEHHQHHQHYQDQGGNVSHYNDSGGQHQVAMGKQRAVSSSSYNAGHGWHVQSQPQQQQDYGQQLTTGNGSPAAMNLDLLRRRTQRTISDPGNDNHGANSSPLMTININVNSYQQQQNFEYNANGGQNHGEQHYPEQQAYQSLQSHHHSNSSVPTTPNNATSHHQVPNSAPPLISPHCLSSSNVNVRNGIALNGSYQQSLPCTPTGPVTFSFSPHQVQQYQQQQALQQQHDDHKSQGAPATPCTPTDGVRTAFGYVSSSGQQQHQFAEPSPYSVHSQSSPFNMSQNSINQGQQQPLTPCTPTTPHGHQQQEPIYEVPLMQYLNPGSSVEGGGGGSDEVGNAFYDANDQAELDSLMEQIEQDSQQNHQSGSGAVIVEDEGYFSSAQGPLALVENQAPHHDMMASSLSSQARAQIISGPHAYGNDQVDRSLTHSDEHLPSDSSRYDIVGSGDVVLDSSRQSREIIQQHRYVSTAGKQMFYANSVTLPDQANAQTQMDVKSESLMTETELALPSVASIARPVLESISSAGSGEVDGMATRHGSLAVNSQRTSQRSELRSSSPNLVMNLSPSVSEAEPATLAALDTGRLEDEDEDMDDDVFVSPAQVPSDVNTAPSVPSHGLALAGAMTDLPPSTPLSSLPYYRLASIAKQAVSSVDTSSSRRTKHKPEPLYIPPHVNALGQYHSRLRSPRLWDKSASSHHSLSSISGGGPFGSYLIGHHHPSITKHEHSKVAISPPPYTPPPMLSPVRTGSGLYWHISGGATPKSGHCPGNVATSFIYSRKSLAYVSEHAKENEVVPTPTTAYEPFDLQEIPETDVQPHVNVGPQFQARIPTFSPNSLTRYKKKEHASLVFDPSVFQDQANGLADEEIEAFLEVACSACVPGASRNKEYAYHLLYMAGGDLHAALVKLLSGRPRLGRDHPLLGYKYPESDTWTTEQVQQYHRALVKFDKDFSAVSKEVRALGTNLC